MHERTERRAKGRAKGRAKITPPVGHLASVTGRERRVSKAAVRTDRTLRRVLAPRLFGAKTEACAGRPTAAR